MAFVSDLFDFVRDQLLDPDDTQVPFLTKKLYLNQGIARLWPNIFRFANYTISLEDGTYDYALDPEAAAGFLVAVEIESEAGSDNFLRYPHYDVIPGDETGDTGWFRLTTRHPGELDIRLTVAVPIPYIESVDYEDAQAEEWLGPSRAINFPGLYALSMCTLRKADERQDTYRYSTTQATNGVSDRDITSLAQMWMAQFELELQAFERPLPVARD